MRSTAINPQKDWFLSKVEIADNLFSQYGFNGEADAEILLCCAASALASKMWPGEKIDRVRFTEFLIKFTGSNIDIQRISIPALAAKLKDKNRSAEANILLNNYLQNDNGQVFICDAVDKSEDAILSLCPSIESKIIRDASHVGIIYKDLRCGLVHEGRTSKLVFHDFPPSNTNVPYYANLLIEPNLPIEHPLCFPYHYIRDILVSVVENAFAYRETVNSWDTSEPVKWWIEGK